MTLFRHFPTKLKLLEDVLISRSHVPRIKTLSEKLKGMEYRDVLFHVLKGFHEMLFEQTDFVKIIYAEQYLYSEEVTSLHTKPANATHAPIVSYLKELQQKDVLRDFNAEFAARILFGMIFFFFQEQIYFPSKDPFDWDAIIRNYVIEIFARELNVYHPTLTCSNSIMDRVNMCV